MWHGQRDSNPRHQVLETCALPTELCPYVEIIPHPARTSRACNFPPRIAWVCTSSTGGLLRPQHPSRMHKVGIAQEEPWHNMGLNCIRIDLRICWVLDRLAPYKLPRALVSLLIYQQPSSPTLYYSYLGIFALIEAGLRNETGKLQT